MNANNYITFRRCPPRICYYRLSITEAAQVTDIVFYFSNDTVYTTTAWPDCIDENVIALLVDLFRVANQLLPWLS